MKKVDQKAKIKQRFSGLFAVKQIIFVKKLTGASTTKKQLHRCCEFQDEWKEDSMVATTRECAWRQSNYFVEISRSTYFEKVYPHFENVKRSKSFQHRVFDLWLRDRKVLVVGIPEKFPREIFRIFQSLNLSISDCGQILVHIGQRNRQTSEEQEHSLWQFDRTSHIFTSASNFLRKTNLRSL